MNNLLEFEEYNAINEGVKDKEGNSLSTGTRVQFKHNRDNVKGKIKRVGIKYRQEGNRKIDDGLELHIEIYFPEKYKGEEVKKDPNKVEVSK